MATNPTRLINDWAEEVRQRPMLSDITSLNTSQKSLSSNERNRQPPTLVRDSHFLGKLEETYRGLLTNDLTVRPRPSVQGSQVTTLEDDYWNVTNFFLVSRSRFIQKETSEASTNQFHKGIILDPLVMLARLIMVQKAAEIKGFPHTHCDALIYRPYIESQIALNNGGEGRVTIPDHIFVGRKDRNPDRNLLCVEDKNTAFSVTHATGVDGRVGRTQSVNLAIGNSIAEKVWRQVSV
jgi:hypothetical protein